MGRTYIDDLRAGGLTQLHPNDHLGGILIFDCNEVIAECTEDGESHQLQLVRPLTEEEAHNFGALNGNGFDEEFVSGEITYPVSAMERADGPGVYWITCGPINEEAKDYILSLTADARWGR